MKRLICIYFALFATMSLQARSVLVATLYHTANDSTSVYYGIEALENAYNASTDGDVITLSSGAFTSPGIITKNITIRGAGMEADTVNNIAPTIISGAMYIQSGSLSNSHQYFTMEGIYHDSSVFIDSEDNEATNTQKSLRYAHFVKCRFKKIDTSENARYGTASNWFYTYSYFKNVSFTQCVIHSITMDGNASFYNCIVDNPSPVDASSIIESNYEFINCVVVGDLYQITKSVFYNCALCSISRLASSNVVNGCVGCNDKTPSNDLFSSLSAAMSKTNHSFTSADAIFKTFPGGSNNVTDQETFELQDSIKTKYLGDDGTQVGIYGGPVPFSLKTTLPVVSRFKVASKSDESGKLKVEMQVNTPQ